MIERFMAMGMRRAIGTITVCSAVVFASSWAIAADADAVGYQFRNNVAAQRTVPGATAGQAQANPQGVAPVGGATGVGGLNLGASQMVGGLLIVAALIGLAVSLHGGENSTTSTASTSTATNR